jgi:hypothetical protein
MLTCEARWYLAVPVLSKPVPAFHILLSSLGEAERTNQVQKQMRKTVGIIALSSQLNKYRKFVQISLQMNDSSC